MKPLRFLLLLAACTISAATATRAATTLSGLVSNRATGQYLEGATVTLVELGRVTLTDASGRYRFEDVPTGNHQVAVAYTGLDTTRLGGGGPNLLVGNEAGRFLLLRGANLSVSPAPRPAP